MSAPNFSEPTIEAFLDPTSSTEVEKSKLTRTATETITAAVLNFVPLRSLTMRRLSLKRVSCPDQRVLRTPILIGTQSNQHACATPCGQPVDLGVFSFKSE